MNYVDIVLNVQGFIEQEYSIECNCYVGDPVTHDMITKTEKIMNFPIPKQLVDFYCQIGDGIEMDWNLDESEKCDTDHVFGGICIPSLKELIRALDGWEEMCRPNIENAYEDSPESSNKKLKFQEIYDRSINCIPIIDAGEDVICIEKDGRKDPIVYWDHGTCELDYMSECFEKFFLDWSKVNFQRPIFWPTLPGGVDWKSNYFYEPFRQKSE
jgi:hypothetical protein